MDQSVIMQAPVQALQQDGPIWIEALPARKYQTPFYGEVPVTPEKLQNFIKNFKENVRGQDIAIDFEHGTDAAKGKQAAGWYKDFDIRPSSDDPTQVSLWSEIDLTDDTKKEIAEKKWKYFSLEWDDDYEDSEGNKAKDVIIGGAITNRPVAKRTLPINFSENMWKELNEEERKYFAVEAIDRMTGESKEWEHSEPGTGSPPEPRTDQDGSDDVAIREGWRRVSPPPQDTQGPSGPSQKHNSTHTKGGLKMEEFAFAEKDARELLHALNLDHDTKPEEVMEKLKIMFSEVKELRRGQSATDQEKKFAEEYPEFWGEHNQLMERDRTNSAKAFAEGVKTIRRPEGFGLKNTKLELSVQAQAEIVEVHKKFAEGKVTQEDFEKVIKTVVNGGIVKFGEIGSGREDDSIPDVDVDTPGGLAGARKLFAEVALKIQKDNAEKNMSYDEACEVAAIKHPDLAEAYRVTLPA